MIRTFHLLLAATAAFSPSVAHADQAECENTVRTLMAPFGENKPKNRENRFGTFVTAIGKQEIRGYSLPTTEGSVCYDQDKIPVSLSFVNGDVYTTAYKGKTWKLANLTAKEVMDQVYEGIRSQAAKARNIVCEYGIDLNGRKVDHYSVDYDICNTGTPTHTEYWSIRTPVSCGAT